MSINNDVFNDNMLSAVEVFDKLSAELFYSVEPTECLMTSRQYQNVMNIVEIARRTIEANPLTSFVVVDSFLGANEKRLINSYVPVYYWSDLRCEETITNEEPAISASTSEESIVAVEPNKENLSSSSEESMRRTSPYVKKAFESVGSLKPKTMPTKPPSTHRMLTRGQIKQARASTSSPELG
jgi:hypothetical protein